jgi:filamentous hemagglutinin family protein
MTTSPSKHAASLTAVLAFGFITPAMSNPTGPAVVSGSASVASTGSTLTVTNTANTVINWQTFSIGAGEITRFNQPSPASAVLNRVITQDPSTILGSLQSNGRIYLINPGGIVFGAGSRVDAAGLVASTLNLSDADFLAGRLRFDGTVGAGPVVNNGTIATFGEAGAPVYLVGPVVINGGVITSPGGEVLLAAGTSVEVVDPGTPNISVQITAPGNQALNLGTILAASGRVNIFAGLVQQLGVVQADMLAVGQDGAIVLEAANGTSPGATTVAGTTPGFAATAPTGNPATALGPVTPSMLSGETLSTTTAGGTSAITAGETATFSSTVPTLITGVPTFTSSVPTLITGVPTFTSPAPTTAPIVTQSLSPAPSFFTTPTFSTATPTTAPFAATIPLQ